ncbi:MAG: hypothetical protein JWN05_3414 [Arthrobacter sp.]|nr:hypothetical protein [Arthrobacter sp.]
MFGGRRTPYRGVSRETWRAGGQRRRPPSSGSGFPGVNGSRQQVSTLWGYRRDMVLTGDLEPSPEPGITSRGTARNDNN